ncbi:MAG: DsbA family protein [Taibaiella sp.]|nr:DsbA family protein [Taibaiella sp.]
MEASSNPLLCDATTGMCEMTTANVVSGNALTRPPMKALRIIYFTDPICSSCWAIEPQLRKLKLEYGNSVEIEYHMGGLLPDWRYNSGGISKPSDVAHHWDEVSRIFGMPIDGDVWLEDPLNSSYPPSIAFKAAQLQGNDLAIVFLRNVREMVFLQKKNITKWEHIAVAATDAGLDVDRLRGDYDGVAKSLFEADLDMAGSLGVRGFPTFMFVDQFGNSETMLCSKSYGNFERAIKKHAPLVKKEQYAREWAALFAVFPTLTTKEFAELMEITPTEADTQLESLADRKLLDVFRTKNGALWMRW